MAEVFAYPMYIEQMVLRKDGKLVSWADIEAQKYADWISIEERKPEEEELVLLLCLDEFKNHYICLGFYENILRDEDGFNERARQMYPNGAFRFEKHYDYNYLGILIVDNVIKWKSFDYPAEIIYNNKEGAHSSRGGK